jgi:hypothetical protein
MMPLTETFFSFLSTKVVSFGKTSKIPKLRVPLRYVR